MEVILKANVPHLGNMMDVVNVKNGFAMNYLIPNKLAIRATAEAKKKIAENREAMEALFNKELGNAKALAAKLAETPVKVSAKVSESGKIFGSVTTAQIAEALVAAGLEVDKKDITLASDIKALGTYEATVKCYKDIKGTVSVEVVAE